MMGRLPRPARSSILVAIVAAGFAFLVGGGRIFSPGGLSSENRSGATLGGATSHTDLAGNCSACHAPPWSRSTMSSLCLDCHVDIRKQIDAGGPLHGKLPAANDCRQCHSEHHGPHGILTSLERFDHDCAAFPLTGKHLNLECSACHKSRPHKAVASACYGCHAEPAVHHGRYGVECASCHTTSNWKGAVVNLTAGSFDHDRTAFKLTGKHRTTDCKSCHATGVFKGTSQSCVSCHAEPVVHKGKFGVECASCHTTSNWKGAVVNLTAGSFDHDRTAFKLTGKHRTTDCKSCHATGVFKGTSQSCVSCHAEPPTPLVHKARYGANCAMCHNTVSFKGSSFKHTFPINHGSRRGKGAVGGNTCATCHNNPENLAVYTCYNCHVHEPTRIARIHAGRKIANLQECAKCHKTGRERAALELPDDELFFIRFFAENRAIACSRP